MPMRVVRHGKVTAESLAQVEMAVSDQQNLQDMMAWAMAQPAGTFTPQIVAEVLVQDEFTHDVIVPRTDGLVLVYDTT